MNYLCVVSSFFFREFLQVGKYRFLHRTLRNEKCHSFLIRTSALTLIISISFGKY